MSYSIFKFPTRIVSGIDGLSTLVPALQEAGVKRPLVITDRGLAQMPIIDQILQLLQGAQFAPRVFSEIEGNPTESHVNAGVAAYKNFQSDSCVIIGGGSAMDVGKVVALLATNNGGVFDYEDDKPGAFKVTTALPFCVAIPTTAGTGSEVGRSSVISDNETKEKKIIFAPEMLVPLVIADPALSVGLPGFLTAATGVDALTHCMEGYLAKGVHPMCDGIGLEGMRLIATHLKTAVHEPGHLEARGAMLNAAMMGAVAFQKGLGVTHSCAHALSAVFNTHHGLANALMFPACMRFNAEVVPEKFKRIGEALGLSPCNFAGFNHWYTELCDSIGLKLGLEAHGIEITEPLIDFALKDGCHQQNPRPVTRDQFKALFTEAL